MKNFEIAGLSGQQEISLQELWGMAWRRKCVIIISSLTVFVLVTLYSFLATPIYTAVGQLLIDREPNILSFEDIFQIAPLNDDYFQTQYKLLQSRALAGDTIDRMQLYENDPSIKAAIKGGTIRAEDLKNDPSVRRRLIDALLKRLI